MRMFRPSEKYIGISQKITLYRALDMLRYDYAVFLIKSWSKGAKQCNSKSM